MNRTMARWTAAAAILAMLAAPAVAQQLGQRFTSAGQQYEIVQFRVLGIGCGCRRASPRPGWSTRA